MVTCNQWLYLTKLTKLVLLKLNSSQQIKKLMNLMSYKYFNLLVSIFLYFKFVLYSLFIHLFHYLILDRNENWTIFIVLGAETFIFRNRNTRNCGNLKKNNDFKLFLKNLNKSILYILFKKLRLLPLLVSDFYPF